MKGRVTTLKVNRLDNDEKSAILLMSAKGKSVDEIALAVNRSKSAVSRFIAEMADTSVLAKATLKAGAAALAERVIKQADVSESIEVLSRPGMDILQPAQQKGGSGGGFRVSVGVGSCGTVVQVEGGINAQGQLPAGDGETGAQSDRGSTRLGYPADVAVEVQGAER